MKENLEITMDTLHKYERYDIFYAVPHKTKFNGCLTKPPSNLMYGLVITCYYS